MAVLAVSDARKYLNISGIQHDDELEDMIPAVEAVISKHVGPLEPTTVTTRLTGVGDALILPIHPVISITSITDYAGNALTVGDFYLDGTAGLVTYLSAGRTFGSHSYTVVYQAGRTVCPPDLLEAVKALLKHTWESQRRVMNGNPIVGEGPVDVTGGANYLLPYRVQELLAPHIQVPVA